MNLLITMTIAFGMMATTPGLQVAPSEKVDYETVLQCSLQKHSDLTRRYAAYHLLRRDNQTWQQNEADPDSSLMYPALEGCLDLKKQGMPFPPDWLVRDWGEAHGIGKPMQIGSALDLARCTATYSRDIGREYLQSQSIQKLTTFGRLSTAMCRMSPGIKIDMQSFDDLLRSEMESALTAQSASKVGKATN